MLYGSSTVKPPRPRNLLIVPRFALIQCTLESLAAQTSPLFNNAMRDQHCKKPTFWLPVPEPAQSCFFSLRTSFQLYDGVTCADIWVLVLHWLGICAKTFESTTHVYSSTSYSATKNNVARSSLSPEAGWEEEISVWQRQLRNWDLFQAQNQGWGSYFWKGT